MTDLQVLIGSLRAGEVDLDSFARDAAAGFVHRKPMQWPEDQGNEATVDGVSSVTIANAVDSGALTVEEAEAIYAALPDEGP